MPTATTGRVATPQSRPRAALPRLLPSRCLLAAVLAPLALAGCASGGATPMGELFRDALGGDGALAERAAEIPFASLALDAEDRSGLVVLGALAEPESYWPTGNRGLVTLRHEGLHATAGLAADLLDTRYSLPEGDVEAPWRLEAPAPFTLTRTWQHEDGLTVQMSASGTLSCDSPAPRELPLAILTLEPCEMRLSWEKGQRTQATLWRDPESRRLWAGEEQAWPGGPTLGWEVARPWW